MLGSPRRFPYRELNAASAALARSDTTDIFGPIVCLGASSIADRPVSRVSLRTNNSRLLTTHGN